MERQAGHPAARCESALLPIVREKLCTNLKWEMKDLYVRSGRSLLTAPSRYTLSSARAVPWGSAGGAPITSG